jgi:hypothetical protein
MRQTRSPVPGTGSGVFQRLPLVCLEKPSVSSRARFAEQRLRGKSGILWP